MTRQIQSGAALISILILLAFVSFMALGLSKKVQFQISLERNATDKEQAYWYALGAERHITLRLKEQLFSNVNSETEFLVKQQYFFSLEDGEIRTHLRSLRSCFNLNVLSQAAPERGGKGIQDVEVQRLERLLQLKGISNTARRQFVERLMDWLDSDNNPVGTYGREDTFYTQQREPYRSGNTPMSSLEELYLLGGGELPPELMNILCVLPLGAGNQIAINQLESAELLAAMSLGGLSVAQAKLLVEQRPAKGYTAFNELLEVLAWEEEPAFLRKIIRIEPSEYYALNSAVSFRQAQFILQSILWLSRDGSKVMQRQYGPLQ